jgi:membrane carboxypeptidase/penicillin-binding protein PbpC
VGRPSSSAENNRAAPLESVTILQVIDGQGGIWLDCEELQIHCGIQTRPVISAQLAYLMAHILSDETARWPSLGHPNSLEIGRTAAAKIGQLQKGTDAWTVGYTPSLVTGVWLGGGPATVEVQVPTAAAAGLWHAIMQYASHNRPQETWEPPPGISTINVCDPSGLLPTADCPMVVSEVFQAGNEPNHLDNLFQKFQINRETGNLATIFTPPALIEERVYMIVPPEAEEWARKNGLGTVPDSYDAIDIVEARQETAKITSPQMFASIKGRVSILGTAGGQGFSSYRLQAGQGLNPGDWIQIGEDGEIPVTGGKLAQWDTSGLSGLYALQLLVVREDQQVDTHTIQLRVDNQAPEISLRFPEDGQEFAQAEDRTITFQAEASDDLELTEVNFYLDDELINTLTAPPFAVPWDVEAGEHNLAVTAKDGAGNSSKVQVRFAVLP